MFFKVLQNKIGVFFTGLSGNFANFSLGKGENN
jgi:hypothetical protein